MGVEPQSERKLLLFRRIMKRFPKHLTVKYRRRVYRTETLSPELAMVANNIGAGREKFFDEAVFQRRKTIL